VKHVWEFSDGTNATWDGSSSVVVAGESVLAGGIRTMLRLVADGPIGISVATQPSADVDLDLSNIWLIDRMLKIQAARFGVGVLSSTYTPRDEDMTPEVARLVMRDRNRGPGVPGRVY